VRCAINILVIAAHPDDEMLGCGATIAKLSKSNNVHIGILGEGITSRYPSAEEASKNDLESLKDQAKEASDFIGALSIDFAGFPDNRFDSVDLLELIKVVENWVQKYKPDAIYTHHSGDLNIDHELTFRAVLTATRPTSESIVKDIYSFEIPSSTEWSFGTLKSSFTPNVFVNVTDTIEKKLSALKIYKDEMRDFPHPRSLKFVELNSQKWGSVSGVKFAEAFELVRSIR
jgi:LmbE family N-acetylglucosaminyl deacetylase